MKTFKDIVGYEDLYQISNEGNVKSLANDKSKKEKFLKPCADGCGYLVVHLCKEGKVKHPRIHRLVAQAFIPNPLGLPQVNHKDEDKTNNFVFVNEDGSVDLEKSNLEWCDHKYNINHGTRNQRSAETRSKKVYQYNLNGELVKIWSSVNECGRNGFDQGTISLCCNNKYLREGNNIYKGFRWSYVPL